MSVPYLTSISITVLLALSLCTQFLQEVHKPWHPKTGTMFKFAICDNHQCARFKEGLQNFMFWSGKDWVDMSPLDHRTYSGLRETCKIWKAQTVLCSNALTRSIENVLRSSTAQLNFRFSNFASFTQTTMHRTCAQLCKWRLTCARRSTTLTPTVNRLVTEILAPNF